MRKQTLVALVGVGSMSLACVVAAPRVAAVTAPAVTGGAVVAPPDAAAAARGARLASAPAPISAQRLQARILEFAKSLRAPAHSDARHVEAAFKVRLGPPDLTGDMSRSVYKLRLADGSRYGIEVSPEADGFSDVRIPLWLSDGSDPSRVETSYCAFDAARLGRQLEAMGYRRSVDLPYRGATRRTFLRDLDAHRVYEIDLVIYTKTDNTITARAPSAECVSEVQISGGRK